MSKENKATAAVTAALSKPEVDPDVQLIPTVEDAQRFVKEGEFSRAGRVYERNECWKEAAECFNKASREAEEPLQKSNNALYASQNYLKLNSKETQVAGCESAKESLRTATESGNVSAMHRAALQCAKIMSIVTPHNAKDAWLSVVTLGKTLPGSSSVDAKIELATCYVQDNEFDAASIVLQNLIEWSLKNKLTAFSTVSYQMWNLLCRFCSNRGTLDSKEIADAAKINPQWIGSTQSRFIEKLVDYKSSADECQGVWCGHQGRTIESLLRTKAIAARPLIGISGPKRQEGVPEEPFNCPMCQVPMTSNRIDGPGMSGMVFSCATHGSGPTVGDRGPAREFEQKVACC